MSEINIKNILDDQLKKDYQVTVPYSVIDARIDAVIEDIKKNYKMDGFRPGHVPANLIKKKYEVSIMAEESEKIINETSEKIVNDNKLKLALPPKIDIKTFEPNKDFEYVVIMELLPEVPEIDLSKIKLNKFIVKIPQTEIENSIKQIAANHKKWQEQGADYKSKKNDAVNIDYVGTIDGKEFSGGSAKGYQLEIGSKSFIDDFEDQLIGKKAGEEVKVKVKFPKEYHSAEFAGKKAEFAVKINKVLSAEEPKVDDKFVKDNLGLDNLAKLEEAIKEQISSGYESMSRNLFKKELFDLLNKKYDFSLPAGLIESQLKKVWAEVEKELKYNPDKFKNEKEQEKAKGEKRKLAERMIRSGIILSEIAKANKIEAESDDLIAEVKKRAGRFPGQEQRMIEYYQKNPHAIHDLRGEVLEEKVIDFVIKTADITDKEVTVKDLEKEFNKKLKDIQ